MTTVADLLIKIGADGSGLSSELGKTRNTKNVLDKSDKRVLGERGYRNR